METVMELVSYKCLTPSQPVWLSQGGSYGEKAQGGNVNEKESIYAGS